MDKFPSLSLHVSSSCKCCHSSLVLMDSPGQGRQTGTFVLLPTFEEPRACNKSRVYPICCPVHPKCLLMSRLEQLGLASGRNELHLHDEGYTNRGKRDKIWAHFFLLLPRRRHLIVQQSRLNTSVEVNLREACDLQLLHHPSLTSSLSTQRTPLLRVYCAC